MAEDIKTLVTSLARSAKQASRALANADTTRKNAVLLRAELDFRRDFLERTQSDAS
mgnify:CR=1 FL=1